MRGRRVARWGRVDCCGVCIVSTGVDGFETAMGSANSLSLTGEVSKSGTASLIGKELAAGSAIVVGGTDR